MATTPIVICEIDEVSDSETSVYTNPSGTKTFLKLIVVTNSSGDACGMSIWKVPDGESTENSNKLMPNAEIAAGDVVTYHFGDPGIILQNDGDQIYVQAAAASKLNVHMYGYAS